MIVDCFVVVLDCVELTEEMRQTIAVLVVVIKIAVATAALARILHSGRQQIEECRRLSLCSSVRH